MGALTNFQSDKIRAYASVLGTTIDITSLNLTWAANTIPSGQLQVALGREILTGTPAAIHYIVDQLNLTVRCQVYLEVDPGPNSLGFQFEHWPQGPFLIFDGYVTATGYTRTRENVSFNMHIEHWLSDMNFSSAVTETTHTLSPQQLNLVAASLGGQGVVNGFIATSRALDFVNVGTVSTDFWGDALLPWLMNICGLELLGDINGGIEPNDAARRALGRFEPAFTPYQLGVPCALPINRFPGSNSIASSIARDVTDSTINGFESFASTTLWDKLVGTLCNDYRLALIPLINRALIVPAADGIRDTWATIYGEEYQSIDLQTALPRPIKSVRLFTSVGSPQGAMGFRIGQAGLPNVSGGYYENQDYPRGMRIHQNAPRWSADICSPPVFVNDAAMPFGGRPSAIFPGRPPGWSGVTGRQAAQNVIGTGNLWNDMAHSIYVSEALRGRTGGLTGKLRFDISVGSSVCIKCVEDKFVQRALDFSQDDQLFADVKVVTVTVDSESMHASTSFRFGNVRNTQENDSDAMSIDKNPLYTYMWNGAPLCDDPYFDFSPGPSPFGG